MHHEQLVGFRAAQENNTVCNSKTLDQDTRDRPHPCHLSASAAIARTGLSCLGTERYLLIFAAWGLRTAPERLW